MHNLPDPSLDPTSRQLQIETSTLHEARLAYQEAVTSKAMAANHSKTGRGSAIIRRLVGDFVSQIESLCDRVTKPERTPMVGLVVPAIGAGPAAYLGLKVIIDQLLTKPSLQRLIGNIGSAWEREAKMLAFEADNPGYYDRMQQEILKPAKDAYKIVREAFSSTDFVWTNWRRKDRNKAAAWLVEVAIRSGIIETNKIKSGGKKTTTTAMPSARLSKWLKRYDEYCEMSSPELLPMVSEPLPWYNTLYPDHDVPGVMREEGGGYYTLPMTMLKGIDDGYSTYYPDGDMSVVQPVVDAVDRMARVAFRVNGRVLRVVEHYEHLPMGGGILEVFDHEDVAMPTTPANLDVLSKEELRNWLLERLIVHRKREQNQSITLSTKKVVSIARLFRDEPTIYFPKQLDFRGRAYDVPSGLHPQGTSVAKALLEFATAKPLGKAGWYWLRVAAANKFGNDKVTNGERVAWTSENLDWIVLCGSDPIENTEWTKADDPFGFLAVCFEIHDAMSCADPADHLSHLIVHQDGSCNGLQHLSAMLRDDVAGPHVNLSRSQSPRDVYQLVADKLRDEFERITVGTTEPQAIADWRAVRERYDAKWERGRGDNLTRDEHKVRKAEYAETVRDLETVAYAHLWLSSGIINRTLTKRCVMIVPYGGTAYAMSNYLRKSYREQLGDDAPLFAFGKQPFNHASRVLMDAIRKTLRAAPRVMSWIQESVKKISKAGLEVYWTTPLGLVVHQRYPTRRPQRIQTFFDGSIARATVMQEDVAGTIDSTRHVNGSAPNVVHSLDATHMMMTVNALPSDVSFVGIHDSFGTHASDVTVLGKTIRETFVEIYSSDVLGTLKTEWEERYGIELSPLPTYGSLDVTKVRRSTYFFS